MVGFMMMERGEGSRARLRWGENVGILLTTTGKVSPCFSLSLSGLKRAITCTVDVPALLMLRVKVILEKANR
jgi:hypothetical protein